MNIYMLTADSVSWWARRLSASWCSDGLVHETDGPEGAAHVADARPIGDDHAGVFVTVRRLHAPALTAQSDLLVTLPGSLASSCSVVRKCASSGATTLQTPCTVSHGMVPCFWSPRRRQRSPSSFLRAHAARRAERACMSLAVAPSCQGCVVSGSEVHACRGGLHPDTQWARALDIFKTVLRPLYDELASAPRRHH